MKDNRIKQLAKNLVRYSCDVQKGECVLVEGAFSDSELLHEVVSQIHEVGGLPFYNFTDPKTRHAMLAGTNSEHMALWAEMDKARMEKMHAYIGIRGGDNSFELSDISEEKMAIYNGVYFHDVHHNVRVKKTKWVVLRYPTASFAQMAGMSTEKFEDFYFDVCNLDYSKMDEAMTPLVELMNKTDKVRIVDAKTDLTFSIKDIPAVKCSGLRNIPDGEVYTAPVKDSVNGVISYSAPSIFDGKKYENIRLEFENGKIMKATANGSDEIMNIFKRDEGASYVGEFAIGVNPFITFPMLDILFDEKIAGSIHFTPGACYDEASNGNVSGIHWDLVHIQTPEYGGGEIYFDGMLIRKDGIFTLESLKCLNPENLK
ncbi:MAG: aminopeptidase [Bacillota bacterium]